MLSVLRQNRLSETISRAVPGILQHFQRNGDSLVNRRVLYIYCMYYEDVKQLLRMLELPRARTSSLRRRCFARIFLWERTPPTPSLRCRISLKRFRADHPFERKLIGKGWCPNQVVMCLSTVGSVATAYCASLRRHHVRNHSLCSSEECVAYRITVDSAATKHVNHGCSCSHLAAPRVLVETSIRRREIPLVFLGTSHTGQMRIQIVKWEPKYRFVAITHVWSHGLGNAIGNSLPLCQLWRIHGFVVNLIEAPCLFWLDTLCVPREPIQLRRHAIEGIRGVYERACMTLVLDEELLSYRAFDMSEEEKLMKIFLSSWMRRLWTLHEATRSKALVFQFFDGVYSVFEAIQRRLRIIKGNRHQVVFAHPHSLQTVSAFYSILLFRNKTDEASRLAGLWALLRWRHLSWAEDETICMSNILGLDPALVDMLLQTPVQQRMEKFLRLFTFYPTQLLFLRGPRLDVQGLRWAPASWLHCGKLFEEQLALTRCRTSPGLRTERGLTTECHFLTLVSNTSRGRQMYNQRREVSVLLTAGDCRYFEQHIGSAMQDHNFVICLAKKIESSKEVIRGAMVKQETSTRPSTGILSYCYFLCALLVVDHSPCQVEIRDSLYCFPAVIEPGCGTARFCIG